MIIPAKYDRFLKISFSILVILIIVLFGIKTLTGAFIESDVPKQEETGEIVLKIHKLINVERTKASLEELKHMRSDAEHLEYFSLDAMESVIQKYVSAYHVFRDFMERGSTYGMDTLFQDMIYILHFIQDVKLFKQVNPDKPFIYEAQEHTFLMEKVRKVLGDGTQKFLDYMIELKEKKPELFYDLLTDYELSSRRITPIMHER